MKLRFFALEIAAIVIVVIVLILFVEGSPFLASSKPDSALDVYEQSEFAKGTLTLVTGQRESIAFSYSTYDPAILVLEITFTNWQTSGNLSIYCNTRRVTTVYASPEKTQITLNIISLSGLDWVKTPTLTKPSAVNSLGFVSELVNGYEGTFSYELCVRGSR